MSEPETASPAPRRLIGQAFVVTGATRGIGRALAVRLAREGATLVLGGRDAAALKALAQEVERLGARCLPVEGDLSRAADAQALASAAERFANAGPSAAGAQAGPGAGIDALINNAGIVHRKSLAETDVASWDETIDVNLKAPYLLTRALLPGMLARKRGRIVNVGSISSVIGTAGLTAYCASKWGLLGFTKALAKELEGTGVSVTAVLPGSTDTEMLKGSGFDPTLSADQVARLLSFVAGAAPTAMNGAVFELFD